MLGIKIRVQFIECLLKIARRRFARASDPKEAISLLSKSATREIVCKRSVTHPWIVLLNPWSNCENYFMRLTFAQRHILAENYLLPESRDWVKSRDLPYARSILQKISLLCRFLEIFPANYNLPFRHQPFHISWGQVTSNTITVATDLSFALSFRHRLVIIFTAYSQTVFLSKVPSDWNTEMETPKAWSFCSSTWSTFDYRFVYRSRLAVSQPLMSLNRWKLESRERVDACNVKQVRFAGSRHFNVSFI